MWMVWANQNALAVGIRPKRLLAIQIAMGRPQHAALDRLYATVGGDVGNDDEKIRVQRGACRPQRYRHRTANRSRFVKPQPVFQLFDLVIHDTCLDFVVICHFIVGTVLYWGDGRKLSIGRHEVASPNRVRQWEISSTQRFVEVLEILLNFKKDLDSRIWVVHFFEET